MSPTNLQLLRNSLNSDDKTSVSSIAALFPTCKGPLEAPDPPVRDQYICSTCIQCACPVWEKLAAQCLRCVRLKGKGNEETDQNNKWKTATSPDLSDCLPTAAPPALLWLSCHVSGGCYSGHFYKRIKKNKKKREDAPGGETSRFQGERECGETVTEPGRGICGTVPLHVGQKRRIFTRYNVL